MSGSRVSSRAMVIFLPLASISGKFICGGETTTFSIAPCILMFSSKVSVILFGNAFFSPNFGEVCTTWGGVSS